MNSCPLKVKPKPWIVGTIVAAIAASGGIILVGLAQSGWPTHHSADSSAVQPKTLPNIAALGRLEPTGEIVKIAVPLNLDGDRLSTLKVNLGDTVLAM